MIGGAAVPGGVTGAVLGPLLSGDQHRPRLTVYGAAGARTELSTASLANWSAKVAGLLIDELGVRPGDLVPVLLPAGWQTAPILLGVWWAGAVVTDQDVDAPAAFVVPGTDAGAEEVFVVSGHPLGLPSQTVAAHQRDFTGAVLQQADRFTPRNRVARTDPVVRTAAGQTTLDDLLAAAADLAPGLRLLTDRGWDLPHGVATRLLGPLLADGSLVQLIAPDVDAAAVSAAERTSATDLG